MFAPVGKIELRRWHCHKCSGVFWVDCDDDDYPQHCPHCRADNYNGEDHTQSFIKSNATVLINA